MMGKNWVMGGLVSVVLSGCGGGGSSPAPTPGPSSSVSGTVAVGSPLSGATVEVKCVKGSASALTDAAGTFGMNVTSAEFPCLIKASGGTLASGAVNTDVFYSATNAAGRVNITPLSHFVVAKALGKLPGDVFPNFGNFTPDFAAISDAKLAAAQASVAKEIAKLGINASLGSTNLLTVVFTATANDPIDQYTSLVYNSLSLNSKTLTSATQELVSATGSLQITGVPKGVCRPGVLAGFDGKLGTDEKLAFVPISLNLGTVAEGGGDGPGPGGGDGSAGDGSLGQFFATTMTVERADGTMLGTVKTSTNSGAFTMVTCGYAGPLKITAFGSTGSKYYDEGLAQTVSFEGETMRVVVEAATKNIGITPFTEAAYRYLTTKLNPSGLTGTAAWANAPRIAQANGQILNAVNRLLPKEMFLTDITRMPAVVGPTTVAGSIPDTANGIYGLVIAGLALQTKNFNNTLTRPGLDSLKQLADDLSDGVIDRTGNTSGQGVSTAAQAAYTADSLAASVSASIGQLAKQTGVASLANRRYTVTRIVWNASSTSYEAQLPTLPNLGKYSYVDLLSDGSIRVIHPTTNAVLADSFDETKSPFLVPSVGSQARIVKLIGGVPLILAIDSTGKVYAGGNAGARQGNGSAISGDQPLLHPVTASWGSVGVSLLAHTGGRSAYARTADGRIWGWGSNDLGQMGTVNAESFVPVSLFPTVSDFVSVSMGDESMFAIKADGTVWSWGNNSINAAAFARLGRGTGNLPFSNQLAQIAGLTNVVSVVPSAKAIFALNGAGEVYGWASNFCNVLGDSVASSVSYVGFPAKLGLTNVIAIATSGATGYALKSDGTLVYWGSLPANVLDPGETWVDRNPAVCKRFPATVPFIVGDPRNPGFDSNTKFVKLEKVGFGAVATTASGQIAVVYGSNAFGPSTNN